MKARDLKPAYSWESRQPVLQDSILFIPKFYQDHQSFGRLDFSLLFKNNHEVVVEYCSGNGAWIVDKAKRHPEKNWIAVEKRFERAAKIWAKAKNESLGNLFVVYGDAFDFTKYYAAENSLSEIYVNFPDPWPKAKHAKHRLIQQKFLDDLQTAAKPGSAMVIATDDKDYCEVILLELSNRKDWCFGFPSPFYINDWPNYGASFFDGLWRSKGRCIYYLKFNKI